MQVSLPPDEDLMNLRAIWPTAWNDVCPSNSERVRLEQIASGRWVQVNGVNVRKERA